MNVYNNISYNISNYNIQYLNIVYYVWDTPITNNNQ